MIIRMVWVGIHYVSEFMFLVLVVIDLVLITLALSRQRKLYYFPI